jgi:hypothetical protein
MDLDLVGYLYGLLDPDEHARTEEGLRSDPAVRERLERLRANLSPLALARGDESPPVGLAERTLARIDRHVKPMPASDRDQVFAPSRWRRADSLVAACMLVVVGGLGVSGIGQIRWQHNRTVCANNLHMVSSEIDSFGDSHGGMVPRISERPPHNFAGAFIPILQDSGRLTAGMPPCPVAEVVATPHAGGYAYSIGYRGPDGQLHGLRRVDGSDLWPVMADRPSPVSHGTGHNVLFLGGNVRYCTTPNVGVAGDDIFTNQRGEIGPGLHQLDSSLADGHISPVH